MLSDFLFSFLIMTNSADKHAQICNLFWLPLPLIDVKTFPSVSSISVPDATAWEKIGFSTAEFSENKQESGAPVEQEFSATATDTSDKSFNRLLYLFSVYGLLRIDYTNNERRVVGTEDFPIYMSFRRNEKTAVFTLSFKRTSPELSKILLTC
ncbi:hypothetical protein EZS27_013482 [termite gut metagenome]|uniref:Uncharacterized protein n=1 Tax=termite gut metagenome TaxID=433724 RepID=A0A5J4RX22_9ZZZZ